MTFFLFSLGLSSISSHWWKEQVGQSHTSHVIITCCLCLSFISSLHPSVQQLSLDYGVPVKVVLDVVCSEHASHLEVSWRQHVLLLLLLLAQLAEMAWTMRERQRKLGNSITKHSKFFNLIHKWLKQLVQEFYCYLELYQEVGPNNIHILMISSEVQDMFTSLFLHKGPCKVWFFV